MPALEKNKIYRAVIEGYSSEGLGIARIDGMVVFVAGGVTGDKLKIKIIKTAFQTEGGLFLLFIPG